MITAICIGLSLLSGWRCIHWVTTFTLIHQHSRIANKLLRDQAAIHAGIYGALTFALAFIGGYFA